MAFLKAADHKSAQDQKLKKLKLQIDIAEKQMADQALLRHRLEELVSTRLVRTDGSFDRSKSNHWAQKWRTDESYRYFSNNHSSTHTKIVEEILAKRTREFQRSQAEKAAKNKYLTQERQRILEAHKQLREKHRTLFRVPSPVGKATEHMWGNKYSLYTPLHYDPHTQVYAPAFQDGYYTYFPNAKRKRRWFNGSMLFVPTPLYQSTW